MTMRKKIHIILGTKAQLIKMAPIMVELQQRNIPYRFIFTGQHQETIDDLRQNFGIKKPDIILYRGKDITGILQMLFWILRILSTTMRERKKIFGHIGKHDVVVVHGDTFSTLLGALMGKISGIPVAHVESGLRSFRLFHPFPEEITRLLVFGLTRIYYCPGKWALNNLKNYRGIKIDTHYNTLLDSVRIASKTSLKTRLEIPKSQYSVCTLHRFENIFHKARLQWIVEILIEISQRQKMLFILHLPTKRQLERYGLLAKLKAAKNIELCPRLDYFDFLALIKNCDFVISDGGSNQEECYYLGKPCLLFREQSERQEGIGKNVVVSQYDKSIIDAFVRNPQQYRFNGLRPRTSPSKIIVDHLVSSE